MNQIVKYIKDDSQGNISSGKIVKVNRPKIGNVPAASSTLIRKAMADAHKSMSNTKDESSKVMPSILICEWIFLQLLLLINLFVAHCCNLFSVSFCKNINVLVFDYREKSNSIVPPRIRIVELAKKELWWKMILLVSHIGIMLLLSTILRWTFNRLNVNLCRFWGCNYYRRQ